MCQPPARRNFLAASKEAGAWTTRCQEKGTGKMQLRKTRHYHQGQTDVCINCTREARRLSVRHELDNFDVKKPRPARQEWSQQVRDPTSKFAEPRELFFHLLCQQASVPTTSNGAHKKLAAIVTIHLARRRERSGGHRLPDTFL